LLLCSKKPLASRRVWRGRTLLVGLAALGCGGPNEDLPKDRVWTSPHFRYAARADDTSVCSPVVDQLEAHLQVLGDYLGLTWTGGQISYYKFRDYDDFRSDSGCLTSAGACARPAEVLSPRVLDGHELVHIYTGPLGHPPALFEEGIAEALAPVGRRFMAPERSWRDILAMPRLPDGAWPDLDYSAGGWFVTHVLRRYGPAPFLAFYRAAAANPAAEDIAWQFREVYGAELDDVWREAQVSTPRLPGIPVWECTTAEPMGLGGDAIPVKQSCDGRGAYAGLELPTPTTVTWTDDSKLDFSVSECTGQGGLYTLLSNDSYVPGAMALAAGKYYVAPGLLRVTTKLREAEGMLGPDCAALTPLGVGPDSSDPLVFVIADSAVPWFATLEPTLGSTVRLALDPRRPFGERTATVEACDTCQGPCRPIDATSDIEVSSRVVLRFSNLASFEGATVVRLQTGGAGSAPR
jgi:hypothetical protein